MLLRHVNKAQLCVRMSLMPLHPSIQFDASQIVMKAEIFPGESE